MSALQGGAGMTFHCPCCRLRSSVAVTVPALYLFNQTNRLRTPAWFLAGIRAVILLSVYHVVSCSSSLLNWVFMVCPERHEPLDGPRCLACLSLKGA